MQDRDKIELRRLLLEQRREILRFRETINASWQTLNEPEKEAGEMAGKKNEHGQLLASIDPAYKAKVDQAYRDLYGDEPKSTVVGG